MEPSMIVNPFHYGKPVADPAHFFGRRRELEQIVSRLRNVAFESSSIVGERRIGKTSLLRHLALPETAQKYELGDEYILVYLSFEGFSDISATRFWQWVLDEIYPQIPGEPLRAAVDEARHRESLDLYQIRQLFDAFTRQGLKVVLLFDEFEYVIRNQNSDADFYGGLRHLATHYNLAFVVTSRRELIHYCHSREIAGSPFFNIFANITLKPFNREEATHLVTDYLSRTPISFTQEDIEYALNIAGRHPYFLQMACFFMFDTYLRESTPSRQRYVARRFEENATPNFTYYWSHSRDSEKVILAALALQGKRYPERGITLDEARKLYHPAESWINSLVRRSLVTEFDGGYKLFSPLFQKWVITELTDVTAEGKIHLEEWLEDYHKKFAEKAYEKTRDVIAKVNPKYWTVVGKWLLDSRNREQVTELFSWLSQALA
jgi:hypothetical protein